MLLKLFTILLITVVLSPTVHSNIFDAKKYVKRQVSLDDIIQGALNFVRPIIDTSESLQSGLMTPKKFQSEPVEGRDAEILGVPKYSALDDVPICKSNSRICKFISCSAHNFKNDESISNLNLAAQILADTKLRKAITSDPSTLLTVCREQGLSVTQCKLFANAFQLLDRFISTIEPVGVVARKLHRYIIKDDLYYDDSDAPPIPIHPGTYQNVGSQTWSTHENNMSDPESLFQEMQAAVKKPEVLRLQQSDATTLSDPMKILLNSSDLNTNAVLTAPSSSSTTSNFPTMFTFPPLLFTFPTLATFAPMVSAAAAPLTAAGMQLPPPMNLMTKELQNLLMPNFDSKLLLPNMMPVPVPAVMVPSQQESADIVKPARNRRSNDYYDNIEEEDDTPETTDTSGRNTAVDDVLQVIEQKKPKQVRKGLLDCIRLLEE